MAHSVFLLLVVTAELPLTSISRMLYWLVGSWRDGALIKLLRTWRSGIEAHFGFILPTIYLTLNFTRIPLPSNRMLVSWVVQFTVISLQYRLTLDHTSWALPTLFRNASIFSSSVVWSLILRATTLPAMVVRDNRLTRKDLRVDGSSWCDCSLSFSRGARKSILSWILMA